MPAASGNSVCPSCGEPVGARSTFCIHCGTEFERPDGDGARAGTPSPLETLGRASGRLRAFGPGKLFAATVIPAAIAGVLLDVALSVSIVGTLLAVVAWTALTLHLFRRGKVGRAAIRSVLEAVACMVCVPPLVWAATGGSGNRAPIAVALGAVPAAYALWAHVTVTAPVGSVDDGSERDGESDADSGRESEYEYEFA